MEVPELRACDSQSRLRLIGYEPLFDAVEAVGRKLYGSAWPPFKGLGAELTASVDELIGIPMPPENPAGTWVFAENRPISDGI